MAFSFSRGLRTMAAVTCICSLFAVLTPSLGAQLGPHANALVGGGPASNALLPTGQFVTPLLAPGSAYTPLATGLRPDNNAVANGAVTTALSPDGIEDIRGTDYLGMNDANAYAMDDAFEPYPNYQPYDAIIPGVLCRPPVKPDLVPACANPPVKKTRAVPMARSTKWWTAHGKKLVFSAPHTDNAHDMNRIIWAGTVGDVPYPATRTGEDLSLNRAVVLRTLKVPVPL